MAIQYGDVKVTSLGHDGFLIEAGKVIYIDAYLIDARDKPSADFLLIIHHEFARPNNSFS